MVSSQRASGCSAAVVPGADPTRRPGDGGLSRAGLWRRHSDNGRLISELGLITSRGSELTAGRWTGSGLGYMLTAASFGVEPRGSRTGGVRVKHRRQRVASLTSAEKRHVTAR